MSYAVRQPARSDAGPSIPGVRLRDALVIPTEAPGGAHPGGQHPFSTTTNGARIDLGAGSGYVVWTGQPAGFTLADAGVVAVLLGVPTLALLLVVLFIRRLERRP